MNKLYTVVTALILLIIVCGTYYFSNSNQKFNFDDCIGCSYETCPKQCLDELPRKDAVISEFGKITGFYTQFIYDPTKDEMDGPTEGEKIICPRIVIISSESDSMINVLKDKIKQGSSINDIDKIGRLIANIDLSGLSTQQQNEFRNSTETNPTILSVLRFDYTSPGGASRCFSYLRAITTSNQ